MLVAHASDLHGNLLAIRGVDTSQAEAFVITGDVFPNLTRGKIPTEERFQEDWFVKKRDSIFRDLAGKPVITVDGNHDFISLADMLVKHGYQGEVYSISPDKVIEFGGLRWTGHRLIPWIDGEWAGESTFSELLEAASAVLDHAGAEVLVTHVPPAGILSGPWGCSALTNLLTYKPHSFRHHFFGHVHEHGGKRMEELGMKFYNGACSCRIIDVK